MVGACGRTRRVTLALPPRHPARRPAEAQRAALTNAAPPRQTTPPLPPPAHQCRRPRLFRELYTGSGRIFWNDAARDVTGLERSRTAARDVTGGARGGRSLRRGRVWPSAFKDPSGAVCGLGGVARALKLRVSRMYVVLLSTAHTSRYSANGVQRS